jgi:hypothetical protein
LKTPHFSFFALFSGFPCLTKAKRHLNRIEGIAYGGRYETEKKHDSQLRWRSVKLISVSLTSTCSLIMRIKGRPRQQRVGRTRRAYSSNKNKLVLRPFMRVTLINVTPNQADISQRPPAVEAISRRLM